MQNACSETQQGLAVWSPVRDVIWNQLLKSEINDFLGSDKIKNHSKSKSEFYLSTNNCF